MSKWKRWYIKNKEMMNERDRRRNYRLKVEMVSMMGGECTGCGLTEISLLTVDHIDNDGYKTKNRQKGMSFYRKILRGTVSSDRLQLLCYNCNNVKRVNGGALPAHAARILYCGEHFEKAAVL